MNFFCVLCHAATFLLLGLKWHAKSIQHSSHKIKLGDFDGVARSEGALWRLPLLTLVLPSMAHAIFDYQEMAEKQDYYGLLVAPYILVVLMLAIMAYMNSQDDGEGDNEAPAIPSSGPTEMASVA